MHIAVVGPADPSEFSSDLRSSGDFPDGMAGVPVNGLVRSLLDLGHQVSLFTASPGATQVWRAEGESLTVVSVPLRTRARDRALDMFKSERRALARELALCDAEVFHAHWTYEFAWACLDAKVSPLLVTAHDAPLTILRHLPDAYRVFRLAMAIRVRLSIRHLSVVTPYLARAWRKEMFYRGPVSVIPNSIPKLNLPTTARASIPVVLDVADASRRKNVKVLIAAFKKVRTRFPVAQLHLVGPGLVEEGELAAWTRDQQLSEGVSFLGPLSRTEVASEFAQATVLCHPSLEESQGLCFLEAMSAQLPVIGGRDSGGVTWTLFDGKAGILTDMRDSGAVADSIIDVLERPEAAQARAEAAEEWIHDRYDPEVIAGQYLDVYHALLSTTAAKG
jgi:glycosyltransferase involved in cell wall biosynthesis